MQVHGSCAARDGTGVLLLGPSGAGKSDLVLRLLDRGFVLVADDRVELAEGLAWPADGLAGLLEVRGLGIVRLPYAAPVRLALAVSLGGGGERLPSPARYAAADVPLLHLDAASPSAAAVIALALDCAAGRVAQVAGAFA
jgi:HPr kinase/phosphorylase